MQRPRWCLDEQGFGIDAVRNNMHCDVAEKSRHLFRNIAADGNDSCGTCNVLSLDRKDPAPTVHAPKYSGCRARHSIVDTMMHGNQKREMLRHKTWGQPRIDVDHCRPRRRSRRPRTPRHIFGAMRKPGDLTAQASRAQPCAKPLGEHIRPGIRAHRRKPNTDLAHRRTSAILRPKFSHEKPSANLRIGSVGSGFRSSSTTALAKAAASPD